MQLDRQRSSGRPPPTGTAPWSASVFTWLRKAAECIPVLGTAPTEFTCSNLWSCWNGPRHHVMGVGIRALLALRAGRSYVDPGLRHGLDSASGCQLTPRELQTLQGLARGLTNKVIAGGAEDCSGNGSRRCLGFAPQARGEEPHPSRRESHGPGSEIPRRYHPRHGALPSSAAGDPQHPHFPESLSDVMVPDRLRPGQCLSSASIQAAARGSG